MVPETATGPYEAREDTRPVTRPAYEAARESRRRGVLGERAHRMLCESITAAGVELGAYDHRIVQWLAGMEVESCAVFAGIITRAHQAGQRSAAAAERASIRQLAVEREAACRVPCTSGECPDDCTKTVPFADLIGGEHD